MINGSPDAAIDEFVLDGVQFFVGDDEGTLFFVPAAPVPQLGPSGSPAVTVVRTPRAVMLQLGAQFALAESDVDRLKARLADVKGIQSARLQPAVLGVTEAALLLADQHGALQQIATSTSSRFSPFNAVFSVSLDAEQGANVIGAVNGRTGIFFVEYRFGLATDPFASQPLSTMSRRADVATWFPSGTGKAHVQIVG